MMDSAPTSRAVNLSALGARVVLTGVVGNAVGVDRERAVDMMAFASRVRRVSRNAMGCSAAATAAAVYAGSVMKARVAPTRGYASSP